MKKKGLSASDLALAEAWGLSDIEFCLARKFKDARSLARRYPRIYGRLCRSESGKRESEGMEAFFQAIHSDAAPAKPTPTFHLLVTFKQADASYRRQLACESHRAIVLRRSGVEWFSTKDPSKVTCPWCKQWFAQFDKAYSESDSD